MHKQGTFVTIHFIHTHIEFDFPWTSMQFQLRSLAIGSFRKSFYEACGCFSNEHPFTYCIHMQKVFACIHIKFGYTYIYLQFLGFFAIILPFILLEWYISTKCQYWCMCSKYTYNYHFLLKIKVFAGNRKTWKVRQ